MHLRRHIRQIESVTMLFTDILLNRKNVFVAFNIQIFSELTYINGMHFETENCIRLKLVTWNEDLQNISDKIIAFYVDKNTFVNTK